MTDGGVQKRRITTTEEEAAEGQRETRGTQRDEQRRSEAGGATSGPGGQLTCSEGRRHRSDRQESQRNQLRWKGDSDPARSGSSPTAAWKKQVFCEGKLLRQMS